MTYYANSQAGAWELAKTAGKNAYPLLKIFSKPFILELKLMSTPTTPHEQKKKHHIIIHHAKKPLSVAFIALAIFI
jgi:hypothetical protein